MIDNMMKDYRQRFVFDQLDMRGCVVRLQESSAAIQVTHHYPANLAEVLNQFALAAVLLRDSIKIEGGLTIQLRSQGVVKLLMADCLPDRRVRAIAEFDHDELAPNDPIHLNNLSADAVLAITISPTDGERYQSIVPLDHANLEMCLEDYFARSEQLPSTFRLLASTSDALGVAIHALPAEKVTDKKQSEQHFERITLLLSTLEKDEALSLDSQLLLTRLFHEENCRLFDTHPVEFGCVCSAEKSLDAIKSLGKEEAADIIQEQKLQGNESVIVDCHFCFQRYEFQFQQVIELFA